MPRCRTKLLACHGVCGQPWWVDGEDTEINGPLLRYLYSLTPSRIQPGPWIVCPFSFTILIIPEHTSWAASMAYVTWCLNMPILDNDALFGLFNGACVFNRVMRPRRKHVLTRSRQSRPRATCCTITTSDRVVLLANVA